jgi:TolB protein
MTSRWPSLTDDLLRQALTAEPPAGLADAVFDELSAAIEHTPQRSGLRLGWPSLLTMPWFGPSPAQRRFQWLVWLAVLGLLLAVGIALIALIGAIRRPQVPLGLPGLIAFDSAGQIFVADPDGSHPRQITADAPSSDVQPSFSPNGTRLAYQSIDVSTLTVRLIVMDPDGTHRRVVATLPAVAAASGPTIGWFRLSWSPDSQQLAYTAPVAGTQQMFVVNADGTGQRQIGDTTLEGHDPTWSPTGTRIAFGGGRFDADRGIYVMNADGSATRRLGPLDPGAFGFSAPRWSPKGDRIAFSEVSASRRRIFVVDLEGASSRDLSPAGPGDDSDPAWSPDGTRLAWHRGPTAVPVGQFVVGSADGSDESVLSPAVVGAPTWSPDARTLIGYRADTNTGSRNRLVLIDVAGGGTTEIPAQPGGEASWQWLAPQG